MDFKYFLKLLSEQLLKDNDIRNKAEKEYNELISNNISLIIEYHIQHLFQSSTTTLKSLSLIHLQHIFEINPDFFFNKIQNEVHELICENLINFFQINELKNSQLENISFVVARIASVYIYNGYLKDFPNTLLILSQNSSLELSNSFINCLSQCIKYLSFEFINLNYNLVISIFELSFNNLNNSSFLVSSLRLLYSIIESNNNDENLLYYFN